MRLQGRTFGAPLALETYRSCGPDGEGQAGGQAPNARRTFHEDGQHHDLLSGRQCVECA